MEITEKISTYLKEAKGIDTWEELPEDIQSTLFVIDHGIKSHYSSIEVKRDAQDNPISILVAIPTDKLQPLNKAELQRLIKEPTFESIYLGKIDTSFEFAF